MAIHKNVYCFWKEMPTLENGDTIDGGNWSRSELTEVPQDLIIKNNPNLFNMNLTGQITKESNFGNAKKELCYNLHLDPVGGNVCHLPVEPVKCIHAIIVEQTIDGVTKDIIQGYEDRDL